MLKKIKKIHSKSQNINELVGKYDEIADLLNDLYHMNVKATPDHSPIVYVPKNHTLKNCKVVKIENIEIQSDYISKIDQKIGVKKLNKIKKIVNGAENEEDLYSYIEILVQEYNDLYFYSSVPNFKYPSIFILILENERIVFEDDKHWISKIEYDHSSIYSYKNKNYVLRDGDIFYSQDKDYRPPIEENYIKLGFEYEGYFSYICEIKKPIFYLREYKNENDYIESRNIYSIENKKTLKDFQSDNINKSELPSQQITLKHHIYKRDNPGTEFNLHKQGRVIDTDCIGEFSALEKHTCEVVAWKYKKPKKEEHVTHISFNNKDFEIICSKTFYK